MRFILSRNSLARNCLVIVRFAIVICSSRSHVRHAPRSLGAFAVVLLVYASSLRNRGSVKTVTAVRPAVREHEEEEGRQPIVESSPRHASRAQPVRKPDRIHLSMKSIERSVLSLSFSFTPSERRDVTALNK